MRSFRLSRPRFTVTLGVAGGLTAMVSGLTWLLLTVFASRHSVLYSAVTGLVFFAFVSARAIVSFVRDEPVVSVHPTGIHDARAGQQPFAWDAIRELRLRQVEGEYELDIYLWHGQREAARIGTRPDHTIETASLEGGAEELLRAIAPYRNVILEQ
jgi:hypothetical protein